MAEEATERRAADGRNPARRSGLIWGIVDGSVSISLSMLLAVALNHCPSCGGWWGVGFLSDLTGQDSGLIAVATLLLFPCAVVIFGGIKMFFLLKQEYDERRRARQAEMRGWVSEWVAEEIKEAVSAATEQGREQGRKAERDRIFDSVEELGVQLPPEIARVISGESEPEFQLRQQIRREERERVRRALAQRGSLSEEEIARLLPD